MQTVRAIEDSEQKSHGADCAHLLSALAHLWPRIPLKHIAPLARAVLTDADTATDGRSLCALLWALGTMRQLDTVEAVDAAEALDDALAFEGALDELRASDLRKLYWVKVMAVHAEVADELCIPEEALERCEMPGMTVRALLSSCFLSV